MALSVTDGTDITVSGWTDAVTITKSPTTAFIAFGSKFAINASGLSSSAVTAASLTSSSAGSDNLGDYLDVVLSVTIGTAKALTLRFYDGLEVCHLKWGDSVAGAKCVLTYGTTQTQWFTTLYRYGYGGWDWTDWSSTWKSTTNPMDVSQWPTGTYANTTCGFYGQPYVSEQHGGVGHYIDPSIAGVTWPATYESAWTYATTASALTVTSAQSLAGFCVTTIGGYEGLSLYSRWQIRNLTPTTLANAKKQNAAFYPPGQIATANTGVGGGSSWNMSAANGLISYLATETGKKAHIGAIEADWGWQVYEGTWAFANDLAGYPAAMTAAGHSPGCWLSPRVDSAVKATVDAAYGADCTTGTLYQWGISANQYMWDHTTAAGRAGIEAIAAAIVAAGFRYTRWDVQRNEMWREFGVLKVFADKIKTLDPTFVIETHMPYMQSIADTVRTNDTFSFSATGDSGTKSWSEELKWRCKVAYCSSPHAIIDTDALAHNGWPWSAVANRTFANVKAQAKIMLAYGRPCVYWYDSPDGVIDSVYADTDVAGWMDDYDALPNEVPTRTITGDWDTSYSVLSTYSDGSTITYDATAGTLTFADGCAATAAPDHIDLAWSASTGPYTIERRVV